MKPPFACIPVEDSKRVYASTKGEQMLCKFCIKLEEAVAASVRLDAPNILLGLTESGIRNHARQKEERQVKAKTDLEKHQRSHHKMADTTAVLHLNG
jgi:hypothetical protein